MRRLLILVSFLLLAFSSAFSQISTDAGLTPAQDRWIFRTQYRAMGMENSMMKMNTQMVPVVLGYGITSGVSIMARAMYMRRSFSNSEIVNSGVNDFYLLSKFRLFRRNTATYSFGIAPFVASNIPMGSKDVSNRTWNPEIGLNFSFRPRFFSVDLSTRYIFHDVLEKLTTEHNDRYAIDLAFSGKIPINATSSQVISPVVEFNHSSSNNLLFISPGASFLSSSFGIEALYQIPVHESEQANQMVQTARWIVGLKYLF